MHLHLFYCIAVCLSFYCRAHAIATRCHRSGQDDADSTALPENFCIIDSRQAVQACSGLYFFTHVVCILLDGLVGRSTNVICATALNVMLLWLRSVRATPCVLRPAISRMSSIHYYRLACTHTAGLCHVAAGAAAPSSFAFLPCAFLLLSTCASAKRFATTAQDFATLPLEQLREQLAARRNKIFLLMEEVRRLRIQQRVKVRADPSAFSYHIYCIFCILLSIRLVVAPCWSCIQRPCVKVRPGRAVFC